ncbi:AI-2E family transporter [Pseudomonas aeruginosa]|nr:AI-2E family transporter [Pseudomonas aeruginosa]
MIKVLRDWMQRYFSDEEAVVLAIMLVLGFSVILAFGGMLAPVLAAMVIAFLIQGVVGMLERFRVPHLFAVWLVYSLFLGLLALFLVVLLPLLWQQLFTLFNELPRMLGEWQKRAADRCPSAIQPDQRGAGAQGHRDRARRIRPDRPVGADLVAGSLPAVVNVMIYLVLVPILVFFFLKDRKRFHTWFHRYLPRERGLMKQVWAEMNQQIANYIHGKVIEIVITGAVTTSPSPTWGSTTQRCWPCWSACRWWCRTSARWW